jgi:predicted O-methyltransferase YrrM
MARDAGPPGSDGGFEQAFAAADPIPGWLTRDQAATLYDAASAVPPGGCVVEIGSHHGRSAVVLASALTGGARLVAVDPFPEDWRYGAAGTEQRFRAHLERAGVAARVELHVATSRDVRAAWSGRLDLVYVDGKHDYWTVREDLGWSDLVEPGGWVLVHDAFSSLGVTTALLRDLVASRSLRFAGRTGSLARLQVARPSWRDRARLLAQLPWWMRNLVVKVCLRLGLRPLARALGHHDVADPY